MQFLVDKHRIERAAAAVCDGREAVVQHHRRSRQIKCQRGGVGNALYGCLTVVRKAPCAGIHGNHRNALGGTSHSIVAAVFQRIGEHTLALIVVKIHRQHTGVTGIVMVCGHYRIGGRIIVHTSCPGGGERGQGIGEGGRDIEVGIGGAFMIFFRHGNHDTRIHIHVHRYGHLAAGTHTHAIFRLDGICHLLGSAITYVC